MLQPADTGRPKLNGGFDVCTSHWWSLSSCGPSQPMNCCCGSGPRHWYAGSPLCPFCTDTPVWTTSCTCWLLVNAWITPFHISLLYWTSFKCYSLLPYCNLIFEKVVYQLSDSLCIEYFSHAGDTVSTDYCTAQLVALFSKDTYRIIPLSTVCMQLYSCTWPLCHGVDKLSTYCYYFALYGLLYIK